MTTIDHNILSGLRPVQIDSPVNALAQVLKVQSMQQEGQLGQAKLDEYKRTKDRQNKLLGLVQGLPATATDDDRIGAMKGGGFYDEADKLQTGMLNRRKTESEVNAKAWETQSKKLELAGQAFGYVRQNPTLDAANQTLDYLAQNGVYDAATVAQYKQAIAADPSKIAGLAEQAFRTVLDAKDQLMKIDTRDTGGAVQTTGTDPLTGKVSILGTVSKTQSPDSIASNAQSNTNSLRTATSSKYSADKSAETSRYATNTAAGTAKAAREQADAHFNTTNGAGGKMTEDQSKATGWLVQAENAWTNLRKAAFDKQGKMTAAVAPGFGDGVASLPLMGGIGNSLRSPARQKFVQAASSMSEAFLRAATGAGVNYEEAKQKVEELTPVWGEDPSVTRQKFDAIPLYIDSLKVRAGPGAAKAAGVLAGGASAPAAVKNPVAQTNAKGWALHVDAKGNRAYVSPDGKQFEEAR